MKLTSNITRAFFIVALVSGFASCSYDDDLQPPKRLVDQKAIKNPVDQSVKTAITIGDE